MTKARTPVTGIALAATIMSAGLVVGGASKGSAQESARTLTLSAPFTGGKSRMIDVGRKGDGPGDVFLTTDVPLRDEQTGGRVGSLDSVETILSAAHDGTIHTAGAIRLHDGRIEVAATLRHTDRGQALAVVGGTGAYANARGEVTTRENEKRKVTILQITLEP